MPTVSVLMSVYNGGELLRSSARSILSQHYNDLELIVVDDGSTDATCAFLADLANTDARVRVLRNEQNQGLTASLNRAFTVARGALIARQDADDVSRPDRLARQVAFLERHPDVGLLGSWYDVIDLEGSRVGLNAPPVDDVAVRWCMLFQNAFCHSSVVVRRAVLGSDPWIYDPGLRYAQDYSAWSRLLQRTQGANIRDPLVAYRVHEGNLSARKTSEQQEIADSVSLRNMQSVSPHVPADYTLVRRLRQMYTNGLGGADRNSPGDVAMYFSLLRDFMSNKFGSAAAARLLFRELRKLSSPARAASIRCHAVIALEALRTTWTVLRSI